MADKEQYQTTGWNAAAIAAETSKQAAVEIINQMELAEEYCDASDWESLCQSFGSLDRLKTAIYTHDNFVGA